MGVQAELEKIIEKTRHSPGTKCPLGNPRSGASEKIIPSYAA